MTSFLSIFLYYVNIKIGSFFVSCFSHRINTHPKHFNSMLVLCECWADVSNILVFVGSQLITLDYIFKFRIIITFYFFIRNIFIQMY